MLGKNEIVYYLIEHPFKEEKTIVFDPDKILETLNQFKEGMTVKRILHVPQKEEGQKDQLLAIEKSLVNDYEEGSERSKGWTILYLFGGLALSYLFFQPLFRLGYFPLINFLIRNFKTATPELINAYVDPGGQLAALTIGMILGFSPLILGGVVAYDALKKARKDEEQAQLMRDLKRCALEIVENESLASFYKDGKDLIEETREQAEKLRKARDRYEMIEACEKVRDYLEKLTITTKFYELNGINEHYHKLNDSFYDLEERLKNPRFWRNDKKYIRELLG